MAEDPKPPAEPQKFAGKFDTPEALESGTGELRKTLGLDPLPEDKKLVGPGGMFTDHAALETYYKDLSKGLGNRAPKSKGNEPEAPDSLKITPTEANDDADIPAILQKAGLKAEDLGKQWAEQGTLTDEQYAALKKSGFGKGVVNTYMKTQADNAAAREVAARQMRDDAIKSVGGAEAWQTLSEWAATEITGDELADLNERLDDPKRYKGAIAQLKAAYNEAAGAGRVQPLAGGSTPRSSGLPKPRTGAELADLQRKMQQGDPAAAKVYESLTFDEMHRLTS